MFTTKYAKNAPKVRKSKSGKRRVKAYADGGAVTGDNDGVFYHENRMEHFMAGGSAQGGDTPSGSGSGAEGDSTGVRTTTPKPDGGTPKRSGN